MAIEIPSPLVDFILLGPVDDRRQLQDSPILGDVWIEFGQAPGKPHDLLISPYKTQPAGLVAATIQDELYPPDDDDARTEPAGPVAATMQDDLDHTDDDDARIAYVQGLVVAHLTFREVLRVIVPRTKWWLDKWTRDAKTKAPVHELTKRYFGVKPDVSLADKL